MLCPLSYVLCALFFPPERTFLIDTAVTQWYDLLRRDGVVCPSVHFQEAACSRVRGSLHFWG
jgi:hypothetical protein